MKTFFASLCLLLVFLNATMYGCKGPDKPHDPAPSIDPEPIHNPAPGPQPDPEPVDPDPGPDPDPVEPPEPDPEPEPEPPVPIPLDPAKTFKVNVSYYGSAATAARKAKYQKAICIVKKVVAMDAFKQKILSYDSPYTVNMFYDTSKPNVVIWQNILDGNETLQPDKDNELDVEVEFYYQITSTIGYTYPSSKRIWVNTRFFDDYTPSSVAANLFHEWLHKLGYGHAQSYSASRDHSVPYAIGSLVRTLGKPLESSCN